MWAAVLLFVHLSLKQSSCCFNSKGHTIDIKLFMSVNVLFKGSLNVDTVYTCVVFVSRGRRLWSLYRIQLILLIWAFLYSVSGTLQCSTLGPPPVLSKTALVRGTDRSVHYNTHALCPPYIKLLFSVFSVTVTHPISYLRLQLDVVYIGVPAALYI